MTVDVNKIKCYAVKLILKYITCNKYSIDCCYKSALKALADYKLASFTDCDVPHASLCYLSDLQLSDYTIECGEGVTLLDCTDQVDLALSKFTESCTFTTSLANPDNGTAFPKIYVIDDDSYPLAKININTVVTGVGTNTNCSGSQTDEIESGAQLSGGSPVLDDEYNPHARISLPLYNVNTVHGYMKNIWIAQTINPATLDSSDIEIDISPSTSPYKSCTGCTTVSSADMYFDHPNFSSAMTNILRNAMLTLYGDADLGDFRVETNGTNGYTVSSLVKHNPASTWTGLAKWRSYYEYTLDGTKNLFTNPFDCSVSNYLPFIQRQYTIPLIDCSTVNVTVQGNAGMDLNSSASDMHQLILKSDVGLSSWSITGTKVTNCPKTVLTATTTATNVASKEWLDPLSAFLTSEYTTEADSSGTYTFTITLDNGCSDTDTITV